ncbi:hypothetical protein SNE26_17970 [Mucilaginibacter sp. cycad4]|nr:hypothetical protein [Mucilaginibacter gossypii]WPU97916.1 hypothetical protein SNE26_17970 [Mucilaginibacter gossypii]
MLIALFISYLIRTGKIAALRSFFSERALVKVPVKYTPKYLRRTVQA